jgi:hypothetical protein
MAPFCIPPVVGIPGFETTKLTWWNPGTRPQENFPEDPDWLGAFSLGDGGAGTKPHVQFRALNGVDGAKKYLYLSWVVRVQPSAVPKVNDDGVNLLLGDGTNHVAIKMRLATVASTIDGSNVGALAIQVHPYTTTLGTKFPTPPAWATDTARVWIEYPSPISTVSPAPTVPWAFQIAVPLDTNLAPSGTAVVLPSNASFKMWYEFVVNADPATGSSIVRYPWPGTADSISDTVFVPANLTPVDVALPGTPAGCATGISLSMPDILIEDVTLGSAAPRWQIQLDLTNTPPDVSQPQHQNVFYARPTGVGAAGPKLTARFRLANWGTQFTDTNADSWKTLPAADAVPYQGASGVFTNPEFRFTWPTVRDTDPAVVLTKSSAFNNLYPANASTFQETAEVSVVGNPPIGPQPRDVYLYLETTGLPGVVNVEGPPRGNAVLHSSDFSLFDRGPGRGRTPTVDDIFNNLPSYLVHAYYDTGQTYTRSDGTQAKVLKPQTSFGYIVSHAGPLVGWESRLYGAEKIADNLYVIRVPNNGSSRVKVAIQARESASEAPLPPDGIAGGGSRCSALINWLASKGPIGRILALIVRLICKLLGG